MKIEGHYNIENTHFNENSLEEIFMSEFESRGYTHVSGDTIERNTKEIILKNDLERYLSEKYRDKDLTPIEIKMIMSSFAVLDRNPYVNNRETFRRICGGFSFTRMDKKKPAIWINLIDFKNVENNIFKIVNQLTIQGPKYERRPDAIVYINGIPMVVIEFKSSVKENATVHDAFLQINERYHRDITDLFAYNAFTVISDGVNSKIGTQFTNYDNYYSWNKVNSNDVAKDGIESMDTLLDGVFAKDRLLSIIENYVYFPDESGKNLKIVCRYPQFFGTELLFDNVKGHLKPEGDGKGGTYFGTTGCGKSLTMLFLSRQLMRSKEMKNPTIVLITDRNNLDHQMNDLFVISKRFLMDDNVVQIKSRDDLKQRLKGCASGGVFLTTIQKFSEGVDVLSERNNVVVISDEAHRSQLNLEERDVVIKKRDEKGTVIDTEIKHKLGFAKILHDSLPNATYVGFTGTPIDETLDVFGPIIDQYTMVESERDKITSKLVYEGRASKVTLDSDQLKAVEKYYEDCEKNGSNIYQIEQSKKDMAKMEVVIGNDDRISKVAKDFIGHYEQRVKEGASVKGKALFVCVSRSIAFKLYNKLKELRPEWFVAKESSGEVKPGTEKARSIEMVKMVATRGKDDPRDMYETLGDDEYKKDLEVQYKKEDSNFKIAIVVDMWLTGFDVPSLDTIYIDKPIQKHSLIQAISRVNRIYEGKTCGLVVDYLGIRKELDEALKKYTNGFKPNGFDQVDNFVHVMREYLSILDGIFYGFDQTDFYKGSNKEQLDCLKRAMEFVQKDSETERRFMDAVRKLKTAYNNCTYSDMVTQEERDKVYFYVGVRSLLAKVTTGHAPDKDQMNETVRAMMERAISSDDVVQLIDSSQSISEDTIDLLSDEYLDKIKKIPGLNTKFKLLQRLAKVTISSYKRVNKLKAEEFSVKINALVLKYNDRHYRADDIAIMVNELLETIIMVRKEMNSGNDLGISVEEKAFYDILKHMIDEYKFEFDLELLPEMAKRMKECTDRMCSTLDWSTREDTKAELRMDIVMIMEEFGFPPVYYDGVYKQVFQQMENYKRCSE